MDVFAEGQLRANNLDVAGQVGRWRALTTTINARVRRRADDPVRERVRGSPILNGIRVTWLGP